MKYVRRLFFLVLGLLITLLLSFNIYHFVCRQFLKQELPKVFGYSLLEVVSGSMEPYIHIGDLIVIDTNAVDYQVGDIVTFEDSYASFVTHRIVSIDEKNVITKGDANNSEDPAFPKDKVVGKMVFQIPKFGILLSSFKNPIVLILVFFIGVVVCYLISTDKNGNPIYEDDEKEYVEFLKYRNASKKKSKSKTSEILSPMELEDKEEESKKDLKSFSNDKNISTKKKKNRRKKKKKRKAKKRR